MAAVPGVEEGVRAQGAVLGRVVRYLVSEAGIRQLLDVGSGLPTADNVHEIAHRADPSARVHDSVVLRGGVVEAGAVLVRSIVCPGGVVRRLRLCRSVNC